MIVLKNITIKGDKMLNNLLKKKKKILEDEINQLNQIIKERNLIITNLNQTISANQKILIETKNNILTAKSQLQDYKIELGKAEGLITMQELGLEYQPVTSDIDEIAYKKSLIQESIGELLGYNQATTTVYDYTLNGSLAKGREFQKIFCDNLIVGFNAYFNQKKKNITAFNYEKTKELIIKKFNSINKKASNIGMTLNKSYLDLCLELLEIELSQKIAKEKERARVKEERYRLKEQEKLLAEAEKERKRLEDEKKAMNLAYNKALTEEERNKIVEQIQEIDKRIGDIDYRVANPKAGWVYVIESPSLQGMVKIGTSRRLNGPFERVRELSGSSLPEAFRINGFCFSDDAFELENNMHKYFAKQRVNPNKEFFYITPQEAIKVLKEEFSCDVHFVNDESEDEE